jgi:hypothetical protein
MYQCFDLWYNHIVLTLLTVLTFELYVDVTPVQVPGLQSIHL